MIQVQQGLAVLSFNSALKEQNSNGKCLKRMTITIVISNNYMKKIKEKRKRNKKV